MSDLYKRQKPLKLRKYSSIGIIGAGGIGSWVGFNLALATEGLKKMVIVDPDIIELHNLNRTPYTKYQVGRPKAEALAELINERREDIEVIPVTKTADNPIAIELLSDVDVIIDCRDNLLPLPRKVAEKVFAKLGYDGFTVTIIINPDYSRAMSATYRTVPSYLVPPQFLANIITEALLSPNVEKIFEKEEYYTTITMDQLLEMLQIMDTKKKNGR